MNKGVCKKNKTLSIRTSTTPCSKKQGNKIACLMIYIDDVIITCVDEEIVERMSTSMSLNGTFQISQVLDVYTRSSTFEEHGW